MERHDEIQTFKPETFWKISPEIEVRGAPVTLKYKRGKLFDRKVAQSLLDFLSQEDSVLVSQSLRFFYFLLLFSFLLSLLLLLLDHQFPSCAAALQVRRVKKKEGRKQRPTGLNTVEMLRMASNYLKMGPHQTMSVCPPLSFIIFFQWRGGQEARLLTRKRMAGDLFGCADCGAPVHWRLHLVPPHGEHQVPFQL